MGKSKALFFIFFSWATYAELVVVDEIIAPKITVTPVSKYKDSSTKHWPKKFLDDKAYRTKCEKKLGPVPNPKTDVIKRAPVKTTLNGKEVVRGKDNKLYYQVEGRRTLVEAKYVMEVPDLSSEQNAHGLALMRLGPDHFEPPPPIELPKEGEQKELPPVIEPVELIKTKPGLKVCDNPSLAAATEYCDVDAKIELLRMKSANPNVYWVGISRESFNNVGVIGWNIQTGAACFFGNVSERVHKGKTKLQVNAPGGDNCLGCHLQSDPWIVTPHVKQAWYQLGIPRRFDGFTQGKYNYHVPGIEHSGLSFRAHEATLKDHDGKENDTCTRCHLLVVDPEDDKPGNLTPWIKDAIGEFIYHPRLEKKDIAKIAHAKKRWMPRRVRKRDQKDFEQLQSQLKKFLNGKKTKLVTKSPWGCQSLKENLGGVADISLVKNKDGSFTVKWKGKKQKGLFHTRDEIRFQVKVSLGFKSRQPNAEVLSEEKSIAPVGIESSNKKVGRSHFQFTHRVGFEKSRELASIHYTVTPIHYDPNRTHCPLLTGNARSQSFDSNLRPQYTSSGATVVIDGVELEFELEGKEIHK